jgi:peroxiredoxin
MVRRASLVTAGLLALTGAPAWAETESAQPWLGIRMDQRYAVWGGVAVEIVYPDTAASMCGLRSGDEILSVGRSTVRNSEQLRAEILSRTVGDKLRVTYVRRGDVRRCSARLQPMLEPSELLHLELVDKAAPAFSLERRSTGGTVDDTSIRGRGVVLALFTTSCDACGDTIAALAGRLVSADIDVYAVTSDHPDAIDAYVQRTGMAVEIARDRGELIRRYLDSRLDPVILVIDHKGVVRFAGSGAGVDGVNLEGAELCATRAVRARRKDKA